MISHLLGNLGLPLSTAHRRILQHSSVRSIIIWPWKDHLVSTGVKIYHTIHLGLCLFIHYSRSWMNVMPKIFYLHSFQLLWNKLNRNPQLLDELHCLSVCLFHTNLKNQIFLHPLEDMKQKKV